MPATKLITRLIIYYVVIIIGVWLVLSAMPDIRHYLPIGGAEHLITDASKSNTLDAAAKASHVRTLGQSLGWMTIAILGALVTALPVSWVYMATRTSEEYDQSLISSILILPVVVTSIVVVVGGGANPSLRSVIGVLRSARVGGRGRSPCARARRPGSGAPSSPGTWRSRATSRPRAPTTRPSRRR